VQVFIVIGEPPPPPPTFSVENVVEIMGYGVGEEDKLIVHGNNINVERDTVYRILIYEGCVSVEVHKAKTTSMFSLEVWK
jgi:hypothetical protein